MKLENYKAVKECSPTEISGVISALRVKKGDVLLFQIEVGRMSPNKVEQYLKKTSEVLRTVLPKNCKLLADTNV